jgi:hypothetical protein
MAQHWPKGAGANFVPAYQVSGVPYVTSSLSSNLTTTPVQIDFPYATRFFVVNNIGTVPLRIGFTANGVNAKGEGSVSNYFLLEASGTTGRLELRCKSLFIRTANSTGGYTLMAGLSGVDSGQFPVLTGTMSGSQTGVNYPLFEGVG